MDYSYPEGNSYSYMGGVGPLQAAYAEGSELNNSVEDSQVRLSYWIRELHELTEQHVFDSTAIFLSPYDEFGLEPLVPDLSDMPLTGPEDGSISNRALPRDDSDGQNTEQPPQMSSSDEKEPGAKSRRKEQNRAAYVHKSSSG